MQRKTIIISLYGGPCAGKSTACAGLFYELKKLGYEVEMALEYAKEYVYDEAYSVLNDQLYLFGEQYHRTQRLIGKVDFIITDSPFLLNIYYDHNNNPKIFYDLIAYKYNEFFHKDYFIERNINNFTENGRVHTLEQSLEIDGILRGILDNYNIPYKDIKQDGCVQSILNELKLEGLIK